jgi:phospholipid/cholesterol/gamma-HCH transport system permease protein
MSVVGTESLLITLVTASFVGGVFTIQVAKEFINFGAQQAIGGVLAIALTRELSPVLTAVIIAGRVGSAFAAEIGTMQVTEQIDALYMLRTDPVDYLIIPRVIACIVMMPVLTVLSLITGMAGGMVISESLYNIPYVVFLDSVLNFLRTWDLMSAVAKSIIFGAVIALIGSNWGITTTGGAKGVGESTTTAVVTALLAIFISNFLMTWLLFGDASKNLASSF